MADIILREPDRLKPEERDAYNLLLLKENDELNRIFEAEKTRAKGNIAWLIRLVNIQGGSRSDKFIRLLRLYERWDNIQVPNNSDPEIFKTNTAKVIQFLFRRYINFIPIHAQFNKDEAIGILGFFPDYRRVFQNNANRLRVNNSERGLVIPTTYVTAMEEPASRLPEQLSIQNRPSRKLGKLANVPQSPAPRFPGVASITRQELGGPRTQNISVMRQLPRLNNLMPNTSRRLRNTKGPGNTRRVIQTGVPPIRPTYANMAKGVPLSPAPFPLSPLVSQQKAPSMKVVSSLPAQEESSPCPPDQEEYTNNIGNKACCDPHDIWQVKIGGKLYTICGVLDEEKAAKEVSPPIHLEVSNSVISSAKSENLPVSPAPFPLSPLQSENTSSPPSPNKCQKLFEDLEVLKRKLSKVEGIRRVLRGTERTRRNRLRKTLKQKFRKFQKTCIPYVLEGSPIREQRKIKGRKHISYTRKRSLPGILKRLILIYLKVWSKLPSLNKGDKQVSEIFKGERGLVRYYPDLFSKALVSHPVHYIDFDQPDEFTVYSLAANEQQTGFYGTAAPFRGPLPVVNMGTGLVPLGEVKNRPVVVPNEQQRGSYGTVAPFRGPPSVVNMGTGLVPVGELRNRPVVVPNEQQRGSYGTTAPFRGPPPVVNMGTGVVPVGPLRNLPVTVPNEAQRGSYGTNAPYAPPENVVLSNTSGTGRFITENGKTYFVQEISWAGTRYKIKVFVDKDTTGRQLYDKAYEALRDQVGFFQQAAIRFKGKVDKLTNIEGKIISRNNTKIL